MRGAVTLAVFGSHELTCLQIGNNQDVRRLRREQQQWCVFIVLYRTPVIVVQVSGEKNREMTEMSHRCMAPGRVTMVREASADWPFRTF